MGVHVITSGNHIYDLPEVQQYINDVPQLLRPVNLNVLLPGRGTNVFVMQEKSIRVTNLVGQIFMDPADSPFCAIEKILKNDHSDIHVVDFHAETTSEKAAFAYCYDGQLTAVVGTHTHIPTCDERILPQKTAFVTDLGMTGNYHSILGVRSDIIIDRLRLGLKKRFVFPTGSGKLSGVVVQINRNSNLAERIYRICY